MKVREWLGLCLVGVSFGCATETETVSPKVSDETSNELVVDVETELQDAFNNAACYCENYLIRPTDSTTNPDPKKEWVDGVSADACIGDPRLKKYVDAMQAKAQMQQPPLQGLALRKAGQCMNSTTATTTLSNRAAAPNEYAINGCWDPLAQYDGVGATPSAGFCRGDFDYCIAQQLRLKADSLARPPATPEVRSRILAEARNRFVRAGTQLATTLAKVDRESDQPTVCNSPDTCYEYLGLQSDSQLSTRSRSGGCHEVCNYKGICWNECTPVTPSQTIANNWCQQKRNTRYNELLQLTPDAWDSQVVVTHSLTNSETQYECTVNASYPKFRPLTDATNATPPYQGTRTREARRVSGGYGTVVAGRIADSLSQATDLLDIEIADRTALSDAIPLTTSSYVNDVWGPTGQRTLALKAAYGSRNPLSMFASPLPRGLHRDDGPRRAVALLAQHRIRWPYQRCATSEGWENLTTTQLNTWVTTAFNELATAVATAQNQNASQGPLLLLQQHAVTSTDVRKAYDLLRDQLEQLDVDHSFVVPADAPPGCSRTYLVENAPLSQQRDALVAAQSLVDGSPSGGQCDAWYLSTKSLDDMGTVPALAQLRDRMTSLAATQKLLAWSTEPSLVSANKLARLYLGGTWSWFSTCNLPPYCESGTWSLLGDVSEVQTGDQIRIAKNDAEAYCLVHGHLPGRPTSEACPATSAYPLGPVPYSGGPGVSFSTADFLNQPSGTRFSLFLERCEGSVCSRRLVDTVYPTDTGPYTFSASTMHPFGGIALERIARLLAKDPEDPSRPLLNSLGLENSFVPPLLNPLDSQGNVANESYVELLGRARDSANTASTLMSQAREVEIDYLVELQNVSLQNDAAALAEKDVVQTACGSDAPCDLTRASGVSLTDLGILGDPGPDPGGYPSGNSCAHFIQTNPTFNPESHADKKAYTKAFLGAQLDCTRWMVKKLASMIRFEGLPQAVVDAMPPPGWPNPPPNVDPFATSGGQVKAVYQDLYQSLTDLAIALRQLDTEYQLAKSSLAIGIAAVDESEPSIWQKIGCVAKRVAVIAGTAAATYAAVSNPAFSVASLTAALTSTASLAEGVSQVATAVESAASISSCWSEAGAVAAAREAFGNSLASAEKMKGFYDASLAMFGKVLSADNQLESIETAIALAAEKRALEERLAANSLSLDPSWRAMQGRRLERARQKLVDAQRDAFFARRAIEFRTATELGWLTDPGFAGGAPASWTNEIFVVNQAYIGGGGAVSDAAERILDYADNLDAFTHFYVFTHAFAEDNDRAVLNLRELLGGGSLKENLLFKCADEDEPLPGGHLPDDPPPAAPCDGLGEVESVTVQFVIPTVPSGYTATRLALGNHNYRIRTVGVNLYAFGLMDCSLAESPFECYLETNVRYDLRQDGVVGLDNLDAEQRYYAINNGVINGGRALANESVLPNDPAIVPYEKDVLLGRPLGGTYTLTFRSRPEILWQNLENIQLQVHYEYWTSQN